MYKPVKFGLRFLLACVLLMALAHQFTDALVKQLLPLYRTEIGLLEDRFEILELKPDQEGADRVIRLVVTLAKPVFIGTQYLMPDERGRANSSTLVGNVVQPLVLMFAFLLAWPGMAPRTIAMRLLAAIPFAVIVLMLDVPFVLISALWGLIVDNIAPGTFSPIMFWSDFLQYGGRWVLGLSGAMAAIWLESRMNY